MVHIEKSVVIAFGGMRIPLYVEIALTTEKQIGIQLKKGIC
jgi:hypothetical protein